MAVAGSALECAGRLPADAVPAATVPSLRAALGCSLSGTERAAEVLPQRLS